MPYYEKTYLLPQDKTTEYIILAIALFLIILVSSNNATIQNYV